MKNHFRASASGQSGNKPRAWHLQKVRKPALPEPEVVTLIARTLLLGEIAMEDFATRQVHATRPEHNEGTVARTIEI